MKREMYVNPAQDEAFERYKDGIGFQKDIEKIYDEIDYKKRKPDILGKTVRVTEKQFPQVHKMLTEMSEADDMPCPETYVYEEYYYGAESYGISTPWIEISAKTIADFTDTELRFVLARELYKIKDGVTRQRTFMEQRFNMMSKVPIPFNSQIEQGSKLAFYHWYRLTNYTADNYGYLACGSLKGSVDALLKMVLNSVMLAEQVDVKEFIAQAAEINRLDDTVYNYTKADEQAPYAPQRLQNLLAFAVSGAGLSARITER